MTPSTLPMSPAERPREAPEMREVREARSTRLASRVDRSAEARDFAGELAAAREAAGRVPVPDARQVKLRGDVEDAGELPEDTHEGGPVAARPSAHVSRDMEGLDPALQAAIGRVIARMQAEHGHEVKLVEGVRSPERQAALFAQGRTAPGSVVTWTTSSKHLTGHAADLMVDGGWSNSEGYARLQRIASEEGLQVLGMRDPGHVEIRTDGARHASLSANSHARLDSSITDNRSATRASSGPATPAAVAEVAALARVAEPASVARPAAVAQVAALAAPGMGVVQDSLSGAGTQGGSSGQQGRRQSREAAPAQALDQAGVTGESLLASGHDGRNATQLSEPRFVERVTGVDSLGRIAQVEHVKEVAGPRTPTVLTLRLDNGLGGEDRIRLDLRGTSLGATMDVHDARLAERLGATVHELRQGLDRRGLTAERLQVRTPNAEVLDTARVGAAVLDREAARFSSSQHTPQRQAGEQSSWQQRDAQTRREAQDSTPDRRQQQRREG